MVLLTHIHNNPNLKSGILKSLFIHLALVLLIFALVSCGATKLRRATHNTDKIKSVGNIYAPLKVHMANGYLYVLHSWNYSNSDSILIGYGVQYNPQRKLMHVNVNNDTLYNVDTNAFKLPIGSIALLETNSMDKKPGNLAGITIVGVSGALISIYCIANPKACFGSCPTFYAFDGEEEFLMAEGFSSSILPSFEKRDVDMLYWAQSSDSTVKIKLTNEALETHIIRYVNILAVPKRGDNRVFATEGGDYYSVANAHKPLSCIGPEGDCLDKVMKMDQLERYSMADSTNLLEKEFLEIEFDNISAKENGLLIGSRQTLLTTYLFYQGLAYTGSQSGYLLAEVERGNNFIKKRVTRIWKLLGGIEVYIQNKNGRWILQETIEEMGPIAADIHLVKLAASEDDKLKVRLKMTKGLWRIDYLALASLDSPVSPMQIKPAIAKKDFVTDDHTLKLLHDPSSVLITYPGDVYNLYYNLPESSSKYELFLETRGYYLEWMREQWLEEEDMKKARLMFGFPKKFMRVVAPEFKAIEPQMEEQFWNSRYVKKNN